MGFNPAVEHAMVHAAPVELIAVAVVHGATGTMFVGRLGVTATHSLQAKKSMINAKHCGCITKK